MSRLLIMDDSTELLDALKYIFENNGYFVKTVNNPGKIFHEIAEFQPDILVLDILLGGEDGREICQKLKKDEKNKDLRILIFSANPNYLKDYKTYNADDYIEKPFDISNLLEKINSLLTLKNVCEIAE
jgi:DNA-binding response OmpR family regulator